MAPPFSEEPPTDSDQQPAAPPPTAEEVADKQEEAVPEKLADDDERKEPLYKTAFFTVFPQLKRGVCNDLFVCGHTSCIKDIVCVGRGI